MIPDERPCDSTEILEFTYELNYVMGITVEKFLLARADGRGRIQRKVLDLQIEQHQGTGC
jgi:hypothetical protein